ncbi:MAG TPA: hypothetical protein VES42_21660, partial [Pilimelia sp.]|nr:hypothetical protein [Pilimelia sp.]
AAAGVHALGIGHISAHLDDRFRLLSHGSRVALPRHRTLRAAVDWSYGLLREPERRLFDRLAVFVGGFDLDAVGAVWSPAEDGPEAADTLLTRLVDTSLVAAEAATATTRRFRMLETLRAYGLERLGDRGEAARWRDRHAAYVLALVESARTGLRGDGQAAWLRRLATEHGNIRAALAWSHERGDAPTAVRLAGSLYPLWDRHGHYSEGRRWLSRVLAMPGAVPADVRARAWESAAGLAVVQGDLLRATEAGERAAALSRQAGDPAGEARALQHLGLVAVYSGEPDAATAVLDLSLAQARAADDEWLRGWSLLFMAIAALARAQYDRTTELSAACEAVLPASGDPECRGWALTLRAAAAWRRGEPMAAIAPMSEGLRVFQELGHLWGLSVCFLLAAQLAGRRDDALTAATLLGASETLRGSVGAALLPFVRPWLDEAVVLARDRLGPGPFDRAWRAGAAAPVAASAAMAIGETDPPGPAPWA